MKRMILLSLLCLVSLAGGLQAQWNPDGNAVIQYNLNQKDPLIVSDGAGGEIIAWTDYRDGGYHYYAQRLNASGQYMWSPNSVPFCTADSNRFGLVMCTDGAGGAIFAWYDYRNKATFSADVYAQRVDVTGTPRWGPNGLLLTNIVFDQMNPGITPDGSGGAIIAWHDYRSGLPSNIYAQRVDSSGVALWSSNGVQLNNQPGDQWFPTLVGDGAGGAIVAWQDDYNSVTDIYVQHVDATGDTVWGGNGKAICLATGSSYSTKIVPDGGGGAYLVWQDNRAGGNYDIYAQGIDNSGNIKWRTNGVPVCSAAVRDQKWPVACYDGEGGLIVTWHDERVATNDVNIYIQRLDQTGARSWSTHLGSDSLNGLSICTQAGNQQAPALLATGNGEAIIAWQDARNTYFDIYAQKVDANGNAMWTIGGELICGAYHNQEKPAIAAYLNGGAVITWHDQRNGAGNYDIFAQKVSNIGYVGSPPAPVLLYPMDGYHVSMCYFYWDRLTVNNSIFRLQASPYPSFDTLALNVTADTSFYQDTTWNAPNRWYYWRVRTIDTVSGDSSAWSATFSFFWDTQAPGPLQNLRANGQSPSPWTQTNSFDITCDTTGLDQSFIDAFYYKLGSRPSSSGNFTGVFYDIQATITATHQGAESVFVWCQDEAGNRNYQNAVWTLLRWDQTQPEAMVHSPNGTENWTAGQTRNITWAHYDSCAIAEDSLYYSTDGGGSWTPVARISPPDTIKTWQVPSTPSTTCRVKVAVRDSADNRIEDISNNNFTILPATTPTLAVSYNTLNPPPGGLDTVLQVYNSGDAVPIPFTVNSDSNWLFPSGLQDTTPSDVYLSIGENYSGFTRTGHFTIEASGYNGSPQIVTITQTSVDTVHPWANITNPTPGETKYCGTNLNITWNEGDNIGVIQDSLEYSLDGGASWTFIAKGPIPANGYLWPVPNTPTAQAMVRVIVTDSAGNAGQGISGNFTIADSTRPTVSVTGPDTGDVWTTGSNRTISWNQNDNVGVVRDSVVFSPDFGASWQQVYAGPATSSFLWTVPNFHSASCLIRVVALDSTGNQGYSNSGTFEVRDTIAPQVTAITSPSPGAVWGIGTQREISWQQQDNVSIEYDSLAYSTDGGGSWSYINSVSSGTSYQWTVPGPASANCRVKVVARDAGGNLGELASGVFSMVDATQPYLGVSPLVVSIPAVGGGDSVAVTNSGNDSVFAFTVSCDSAWAVLSSAGGNTPGGFRVTADSNLSGAVRSVNVIVVASGITGSPDTVLVTQQAVDLTAPACTLHAPNGGEALNVGQSFRISWFQHDAGGIARDTLLFTSNGGSTWNFVWAGRDTSYMWTVPNTPSSNCAVRLIVRDSSGNRALDNSDGFFSIADNTPPTVTVNEALSGATLYCGAQYTLQWTQSDNIAVTGDSIYLSTDNQASWVPIAGLPPATSHLWTVPHLPSINCYIKVVASDGAGNKGWDINDFAFSIVDTLKPVVDLSSPNGGENWYGGTVHAILWSQSDNVGIAGDSLYYSADNGASWTFIDTCRTGSYQWTVPSTMTTQGRVRVVAWDAAGNKSSDASQAAFAINQTDVVAPRLYCAQADTARMTYGSDYTFRVYANDNSGISRVRLYWRPGGSAAAPDSAQMYNFPPDTQYVYPLPAVQIPTQGLSYRIAAWDSAGNVVRHPAAGYLLHSVYLSQLAMAQAYVNDKWKMVSFPADIGQRAVANLLTDDLGTYDIYKWRLYEYQADHYVEHGDAAFRPGAVGRAYWLRQKVGASIVLDAENLETASSADSTVAIPLVSQWTDVGNPFLFPVSWSDVKAATGADTAKILGIYTYSGDGWVFPVTGQMSPWEGYCLRISSAGTLRIPMRAAKAGDNGEGGWPDGWRGTVTVSAGGKQDDNYFGIGSGTSEGLDRWDYPEPPSGLTKVSGWFEVEGQDCGADLRPSLGEGQSWAFSSYGREGDLVLAVNLPSEVLKRNKCYWADLSEGMYEEVGLVFSYRYRSGSDDERRDFRLILGTPEYALAELDRSLTAPGSTALLQNRPNPFGENTEIRYHLALPGRVRITVYNVIGQAVRTLVDGEKRAGRYKSAWDGKDDRGRRLGAGVYICRLEAGGNTSTRRMTLVR